MATIKLKRGYDIPLEGVPEPEVDDAPPPASVAVKPRDFHGLIARMDVEEGASVKLGTPIFHDKTFPAVQFTAPASGMVVNVNRGARRAIQEVVIRADGSDTAESFAVPSPSAGRDAVLAILLRCGLFPFLVQRPLARLASPDDVPRDIFVSAMDTAPLAARPDQLLRGREEHFAAGIAALAALTPGTLHVGVAPDGPPLPDLNAAANVQVHTFAGPHPAGNVGVHIHHIAPIAGRHDVVWTCSLKGVLMIGALFATGTLDPQVTVAVTGSNAPRPRYLRTVHGAQIDVLAGDLPDAAATRYISGNPLTGSQTTPAGFLGFFDSSLTLLPEVVEPELIGWVLPGFKAGSRSRTFLSSWLAPSRPVRKHTGLHGGERAFIATGIYREVLPMDVYPEFLMKSILADDIPEMEGLGIYELAEEDVALCEYICPSKIRWQEILRRGLDLIQREA
jgi:Na+-transporting NADH:ubiquinone oxidoreductase subunit A